MNIPGWKFAWPVVATTTACLAFTLSLTAQVQTTTTTATGQPNVVTKVERGEVVTVSGATTWSSRWRMAAVSAILKTCPRAPESR